MNFSEWKTCKTLDGGSWSLCVLGVTAVTFIRNAKLVTLIASLCREIAGWFSACSCPLDGATLLQKCSRIAFVLFTGDVNAGTSVPSAVFT